MLSKQSCSFVPNIINVTIDNALGGCLPKKRARARESFDDRRSFRISFRLSFQSLHGISTPRNLTLPLVIFSIASLALSKGNFSIMQLTPWT
jgi:hypothetical protein